MFIWQPWFQVVKISSRRFLHTTMPFSETCFSVHYKVETSCSHVRADLKCVVWIWHEAQTDLQQLSCYTVQLSRTKTTYPFLIINWGRGVASSQFGNVKCVCGTISLFLPGVNSSSGKFSLTFVAQKRGLQYQTILSLQPLLSCNGNLRNTSYMKKIHNFEL